MSGNDYTLCDCCGSYEPCTPHMLGIEHSLFYFDSEGPDEEIPPGEPVNKSEKWLCADCYEPSMDITGVMPMCVHCGVPLRPGEYRLQLCSSHNRSTAGIDSRAKYNYLRKKSR